MNESYGAVLVCGTIYYAVQGGSNFWVCRQNPMVWPFKWKLLSSTFLWYCLLCWTFKSVDEILLLCPLITLLVSVVGVFNLCFKLDVTSESNSPVLAGRDNNGTFPCVKKKRKRKGKKKYKWFREHCTSKTIYLIASYMMCFTFPVSKFFLHYHFIILFH